MLLRVPLHTLKSQELLISGRSTDRRTLVVSKGDKVSCMTAASLNEIDKSKATRLRRIQRRHLRCCRGAESRLAPAPAPCGAPLTQVGNNSIDIQRTRQVARQADTPKYITICGGQAQCPSPKVCSASMTRPSNVHRY